MGLKDAYTYWQKQREADKEGATGSERDLWYIAVLKPNVLLTVCLFLKNFSLLDNFNELLVRWLVYSYSDHIFIYTVTNMHVMLITLSILCLRILSLVCFYFDFFRLNLIIMPTIITIYITMINIKLFIQAHSLVYHETTFITMYVSICFYKNDAPGN